MSANNNEQTNPTTTNTGNNEVIEVRQLVDLPVARVKRIMKSDVDVRIISQEAVLLVAKATEKMIEHLAKESCKYTLKENRKTIQYKDLVESVKNCDVFDFLEDIIPEKRSFGSVLEQIKKQ
ncbi:hypothetical protein ABK040_007688 [Willaertia magna]